ncbi:MAG: site-2 protease family protein [Ktedonobacteraceae bacterium]|nr:site-2 protease family protein [Ktedonobacteraceae bacterium]
MNNWYLLAAIPVFGLLVLVHELGHFLTAKWAGIRVEEFGIGLPPRVVGIRKRDSGGWEVVWFAGKRGEEDPSAYLNKQTPFGGASGGVSVPGAVSDHTIYSLNLLPIGGFVRMPGESGDVYDEEGRYDPKSFAAKSAGKRIIVLCAGVTMNFLLAMVLFSVAYSLGEPTYPAVIGKVVPGTPAAQAGLRADDTIVSANGHPVQLFTDVQAIVGQALANNKSGLSFVPVQLVIKHAGSSQLVTTTVNARENPPTGQGSMGVEEKIVYISSPVWQAPIKGVQHTFVVTRDFIGGLVQLITGAQKAQLVGPVGIVKITGEVAQSVPAFGWWPILSLTAILSLNLMIVNILPFPALDGGRVVLILIEILRGGKRLRPEREGLINFVGMALLLTLMVVITISDVLHWGG